MRLTLDIDEHIYAHAVAKSIELGISKEKVLEQILRDSFTTEDTNNLDIPDLPNIKEADPISPDVVVQEVPDHPPKDSL